MNYAAHTKFVSKWLDKLEAEDAATTSTSPTTTAEEPQAAPSATPAATVPTAE